MSTAVPAVSAVTTYSPPACLCSFDTEQETASLLLVFNTPVDHAVLHHAFQDISCPHHCAASVSEAIEQLRKSTIGVVVCDEHLIDGTWRAVYDAAQAGARRPLFIVISRWKLPEMEREGVFTVIERPIDETEVIEAVICACKIWHTLGRAQV